MAKQESTAINDLIHLVQGRIIDHGEDLAQDHLFVTAPPAHAMPAHAMPAPLARRRAPNATPPAFPIEDYADNDSATQVDPHAMARFAAGSAPQQMPQQMPQPMPQPILPHYAYPTPAPLPPMPYHASVDATERVAQYDPLPAMEWHARQAPPPSRSSGPFDRLETVRVAALPPPAAEPEPGASGELRAILSQLALPFAGLAVVMMFVGGYVVHNGQGGHKREVPIVMTVSPPPAAAQPAPVPEPVAVAAIVPVAEITAAVAAEPVSEVVAAEPASEVVAAAEVEGDAADAEIEMAPTTVVKHHRASKRTSSSSSSSSSRTMARVARVEPKPVAAAKPRRGADPVAVALAEPTKTRSPTKGSGTGPGKLTITSSPSALIYVDGRSTNQMTPKTLTLSPGSHKITLLEITSRKAKTAEVDVPAGGAAAVAKKF